MERVCSDMGKDFSVVAVIIPFYQKEGGILRRAVESILSQVLAPNIRVNVIIINDISPVPVAAEVDGLHLPATCTLAVHTMSHNGGPGAARNAGIAIASNANADFIAFLDSDDEWTPDHLGNAVARLRAGSDVYFCDHERTGDYTSAFTVDSPMFWQRVAVREVAGEAKSVGPHHFTLSASTMREALVYEYIFQTSTVVYRTEACKHIRFDERLRGAGEDHLFWFDLASVAKVFCISLEIEVICGSGVNIYFGSLSWADPRAVDRHGYRFLMFREMATRPSLRLVDRRWLRAQARRMGLLYGYLLVRHILRGNLPKANLMRLILVQTSNCLAS